MADANTEQRKERTPEDISNFWQVQLALAEKDQKDWTKEAQGVVIRYRAEASVAARSRESRRFNILYSNTEVLKSALYGRTAKPDVRRRFGDKDPVARQAADVVERSLIYVAEAYDVDKCIEKAVHDYLLPGRGVVRVEYEPVIKDRPAIDPMTMQPFMDEGGEAVMEKFIADQIVRERYVYWEDYRQCPARIWDDVWWVAFRHLMTRDDLRAFFDTAPQGSKKHATAADVPLNWSPDTDGKKKIPDDFKKAEVWEVWDRSKAQRLWIVNGFAKPLRVDEDPYGLEGFYPLPEPIRSIEDTDSLVPKPEFCQYQDQADALDEITARIDRLTKALKRRGVYNKAIPELRRLARAGDNEFIPADNWGELSAKGGLQKQFETEDISQIAVVLKELYAQRDMLIQGIYEVTGIADIMRGASDPNETLGAQKLKAQFGSTRLKKRQRAVQKWIGELYKLKAEIIAEHFEPEVLSEMTGVQVGPEVVQLLRSDKLRSYRIDIETDSTVFEDAEELKKSTTEMLGAVAGFLEKGLPAVQMEPRLAPLLFEMLSVGVRTFKEGRKIEDVIEQVAQSLAQPAPPKPNPEAEKAKAEIEMKREEHGMKMQEKQLDAQVHQFKASADVQKIQAATAKAMMPQQEIIP